MWLETISRPEDHTEKCPTCGGGVQRREFGEMYAGAFVSDTGERLEIRRIPDPEYHDPVFLDPITQYFDGGLYRVWPSERYYTRGGEKLHRDAWSRAFGPIPPNSHIHHRDGDPANNTIRNLECLPAAEHLSLTWAKRGDKDTMHLSMHTPTARAAWLAWHSTPEGKLWHSRHALRTKNWEKWKREDRPCEECQMVFSALTRKSGNSQRFCSSICKSAASRRRVKARRDARRMVHSR